MKAGDLEERRMVRGIRVGFFRFVCAPMRRLDSASVHYSGQKRFKFEEIAWIWPRKLGDFVKHKTNTWCHIPTTHTNTIQIHTNLSRLYSSYTSRYPTSRAEPEPEAAAAISRVEASRCFAFLIAEGEVSIRAEGDGVSTVGVYYTVSAFYLNFHACDVCFSACVVCWFGVCSVWVRYISKHQHTSDYNTGLVCI